MKHLIPNAGLALDIDDTLADTNSYWVEELYKLYPHPTMTPEDIKKAHKMLEAAPHWQEPEPQAWMKAGREEGRMQDVLPLIENANHMVEKLRAIVPVVAYITARPESVRGVTQGWLARHGFPELPLILRPEHIPHEEGTLWKAGVLHELYPQILGIVDDSHSLIANLPEDYKGVIFLYGHHEPLRTDIRVVACNTWEEVVTKAQEVFKQ